MDVDVESDSSVAMAKTESSELTREASIAVTIDDLAEGLIVVSFTHSDNLYQGVLFQLNRERGIPSGISFAKEQALSAEKAENDPSQMTPLLQRHSYNQGNCNGSSTSSITQPSLRRIIKPPARFKNARMSLRLRARPVLCAKCMSLCDEKADSSTKDESLKDDNQIQTDKFKKDRVKLVGKSGSTSAISGLSMTGRSKEAEQNVISCPPVDPKDLCYQSIGTTRIVENFWKRPLVQPLARSSEEVYARLRKHKIPGESTKGESRKRIKNSNPTSYFISNNSNSNGHCSVSRSGYQGQDETSHSENAITSPRGDQSSNPLFTKSTVCDRSFPNTRSRKALNLKMCITKLTEMRNKRRRKSRSEDIDAKNTCSTSEDENTSYRNHNPTSPNSHSEASSETPDALSSTEKQSERDADSSKTRASNRKQQAWENRIRTKSTVPVRYRDESYLTKNIFNFNKRRPPVDGNNEIPVLTICRSDVANTFKVSTATDAADPTVSTSRSNDGEDADGDDNDDSESVGVSATTAPSLSSSPREDSVSNSFDISSSPHSPTSSSNINESVQNFSIKSGKPEMTKTPTIKITFGSSGNGMVVQIPPKDTQHVECSSTTDMKAVRKAMKKAKKEARRKRSNSPDMSPNSHALSPDFVSKCERSNPGSPIMPTDHEQNHDEIPDTDPSTDGGSVKGFGSFLTGTDNDGSQNARFPKKKKKQKKKRRTSKTLKENDCFKGSSNGGQDLSSLTLSSPYSNSSLNPDSANAGRCSPGNVSVKSCNLESISNPDPLESFQSFGKDAPPRRRSVPASSTISNSDTPQRVCINLKRIDTNAYVPLPLHSLPAEPEKEEPSPENNDDSESEPSNDYPANESPYSTESDAVVASSMESAEYYCKDTNSEFIYKKGDIVWGKMPSIPWWPGKIVDIINTNSDEARAMVSWYKSTTQSCIRFKMLAPFAEDFDSKYERNRRRGLYQMAVRDALIDAHKLKPEDLPTD